LIYLAVFYSIISFHSRFNRKHDISLIEHRQREEEEEEEDYYSLVYFLFLFIIVLVLDSITRTISILSWSFFTLIRLLLFFFLVCRRVKRLIVLLLQCRISRTLSFLVCLMMTCTRIQYRITIFARELNDLDAYVFYTFVICKCQFSIILLLLLLLFAMRCGDMTCEVRFHFNHYHHHHHMLFSNLYNQCHLSCTHFFLIFFFLLLLLSSNE